MSIAGIEVLRRFGAAKPAVRVFGHKDQPQRNGSIRYSLFGNRAGFSLIELLVVLMLLATMIAIVAPSLGNGLAKAKLKTSSREIAAAIRLARSKAVREQQVYLLRFDLEKREVELANLGGTYRKSFELPEGTRIETSQSGRSTERELENPFFYFTPNGQGQNFQVSLQDERGRMLKVIHNNLKGAAIIDDGDSSNPASGTN
jgi:general secretion pathway protein H